VGGKRFLVHDKMLWLYTLRVAMMSKDQIQTFTTEKATEYHGRAFDFILENV
jgi:hypothetical protein